MPVSQLLQHLYHLDTSSPDFPRHLYCLIQDDEEEKYLSTLQGSELTRLVDFLDKILDIIPISDDVYRRCLHKLQTTCSHHGILPSLYTVSGDLVRNGEYAVSYGGFSEVWEGGYNGKKVCVKQLKVTQQSLLAVGKAFCKEAVMWRRLRHPNVVAFIGVTRDPLQFVSEWMPNGTLTEYLAKTSSANRIGLLLDVAEGLAYLHANCTTHGDLKGPNILIDNDGRARLTDFGFTSVVREVDSVFITHVQGFTPRWAAPEVLESGDKNTREADIFAFGMVMIEVFTGKLPFSEFTATVTISKIMSGERPGRPQEPGLTDPLWNMMGYCWDHDPGRRPKIKKVIGILRERYRLCAMKDHLSISAQRAQGTKPISALSRQTRAPPLGIARTSPLPTPSPSTETVHQFPTPPKSPIRTRSRPVEQTPRRQKSESLAKPGWVNPVPALSQPREVTSPLPPPRAFVNLPREDKSLCAIALVDWKGKFMGDMDLVKGELITNVEKRTEWYYYGEGNNGAKSGMFPGNCVRLQGY